MTHPSIPIVRPAHGRVPLIGACALEPTKVGATVTVSATGEAVDPLSVTLAGANAQVTPIGKEGQVKVNVPVSPSMGVAVYRQLDRLSRYQSRAPRRCRGVTSRRTACLVHSVHNRCRRTADEVRISRIGRNDHVGCSAHECCCRGGLSLWKFNILPPGSLEVCAIGILIWLHAKWAALRESRLMEKPPVDQARFELASAKPDEVDAPPCSLHTTGPQATVRSGVTPRDPRPDGVPFCILILALES